MNYMGSIMFSIRFLKASRVPAALFLGVLGSTWSSWDHFWSPGQSSGPLGNIFAFARDECPVR